MNYISHLNQILNLFIKDYDLNPTHISLYMALFREWNSNRFSQKFHIQRKLIMQAAKIGSNSTYHRCINDLHNSGYIIYKPSKNPHTGTEVQMANFAYCRAPENGHPDGLKMEFYSPCNVPVTINKHENKKINRSPINEHEVINFFNEIGKSRVQALEFFRHYELNNWMTARNQPITDWRAIALNWNKNSFGKEGRRFNQFPVDHLQTLKHKNYNEPL